MFRLLLVFCCVLVFCCACNPDHPTNRKKVFVAESQPQSKVRELITSERYPLWVDSIVNHYVSKTKSPLILVAREDRKKEVWIFDQTLSTDTATYMVFQVGHDLADTAGDAQRFVTDQWLYIDTAKKMLYEYDVVSDSLTLWKAR
jgi:hypothetical protein